MKDGLKRGWIRIDTGKAEIILAPIKTKEHFKQRKLRYRNRTYRIIKVKRKYPEVEAIWEKRKPVEKIK